MRHDEALLSAFDLAGIPCRVEAPDEILARLLSPRYADFSTDAPPRVTLELELVPPPPDDVARRWGAPFARIGGRAGALEIEGAGFHGAFDEGSGRGFIVQPPDPAPLETFLTAICAGALLREGGCLLHAAALVGPDGARVFFGPSESGKTTVAGLVGEGVITDEITVLRPEGSGFRVSGVPWRGTARSAPLAGLFRLRKGETTAFARLAPVAAVRELLGSVFFSRADGGEVARFLETASALVMAVPCWDMSFTPDRAFWDACPGRGAA